MSGIADSSTDNHFVIAPEWSDAAADTLGYHFAESSVCCTENDVVMVLGRRLSAIELTQAGAQRMDFANKSSAIAFNGDEWPRVHWRQS